MALPGAAHARVTFPVEAELAEFADTLADHAAEHVGIPGMLDDISVWRKSFGTTGDQEWLWWNYALVSLAVCSPYPLSSLNVFMFYSTTSRPIHPFCTRRMRELRRTNRCLCLWSFEISNISDCVTVELVLLW